MSRVKTNNTLHSYIRAAERCGWSKRKAKEMMFQAQRKGLTPHCLKPGAIRNYLENKQAYSNKRIKLYQGYIFVFCSTSTKCITVYPLREELLKEI